MDPRIREYLQAGQRAGSIYAIAPPQRAMMGLAGNHLAPRPGSSLEFMDHREYQPGDDLRRIDWAAYARTGEMIVKLYRQEVNPHVDVLVDGSCSMDLEGTRKAQATIGLAGAMASAARNVGFGHAAWIAREGWQRVVNSDQPPVMWGDLALDDRRGLAETTAMMPPSLAAQSMRILISDLLWLGDPITFLSHIAQGAADVTIIQLLARADVDPPARGSVRLVDCESDEHLEVFIDASAQRRYSDALARHQDNWSRAAQQVGARMVTLVAEDVVADWRLTELVAAGVLKVGGA
jgi:uncharacterized protein (DUF58 family)